MDHYVLVSIINGECPLWQDREDVFSAYGTHSIMSHPYIHHFFCIVYKWRSSVFLCLSDRKLLYRKHGFIVEQITSLQDMKELEKWSQNGGPADPEAPSLLDLNDDCLLKVISLVPDNTLVRVCIRLRRLCLTQYQESIRVDESLKNFDRIFHMGEKVKCLDVTKFDSSYNEIFDFMLMRCNNLERLDIVRCNFIGESLNFENINTKLSEMQLCLRMRDMMHLPKVVRNLEKLKIYPKHLKIKDDFPLLNSLILELASLHTVIVVEVQIDVGLTLSKMPQLRVLFCDIGINNSSFPEDHGLIELGLSTFEYGNPNPTYSSHVCHDMIKTLKACKTLRCLRITTITPLEKHDSDLLLSTIMEMQSLEGLKLTHLDFSREFFAAFANRLRIVHHMHFVYETGMNLMLARFTKLEVLLLDGLPYSEDCCNIEVFLKNRPQSPLTIVGYKGFDLPFDIVDPLVTWVDSPNEVFGSFSIFSV